MANLLVDERDHKFVLYEMLSVDKLVQTERYQEHSVETFDMLLETAYKMSQADIWPTYQQGDHEGGAKLVDGQAIIPECLRIPYEKFVADGWLTLDVDFEYGGQQIPLCVSTAAMEAFMAANPAFVFLVYSAIGAGRLIQNFGTEEQKKKYMEPLYDGRWGGTMCLTEPGAGSDVGAILTTATPLGDGTYKISGSKTFITNGDQNINENIVHPVLARIVGDVPGTKGISIFIVPKIRVNDDGSLGKPNDVITSSVEKKMGIKASPTCTLNFGDNDDCIGELLGEERWGMKIMFQMMNEARIIVGLQGVAHSSASFLHAKNYAKERLQGSSIENFKDPTASRVPIIQHPDVRRNLMIMKSYSEGMRALLLYCSYCLDRHMTEEGEQAEYWHNRLDLLTPIVKAYCSDMGFRMCEIGVQVYGGYGFIQEYPVEQFLRDCKIASIYEGANGIQAMDLVGRKLGLNGGQVLMTLLNEISQTAQEQTDGPLAGEAEILNKAREMFGEVAMHLMMSFQQGKLKQTLLAATPVLELMGDVVLGWFHLWQAGIAQKKLDELVKDADLQELCENNADVAFYTGKVSSAKFFINKILTLAPGKATSIKNEDDSAVSIPEEAI